MTMLHWTRILGLLLAIGVIAASEEPQGLQAIYFAHADFTGATVKRVDAVVDFAWPDGAPMPGIGPDWWSALWSGDVDVPASGTYAFSTISDDGVSLAIDGQQVIADWTGHGPTEDVGSVTLAAG